MKPPRPNVVLILTDDQRHDTLHALGNAEIQTPHMDALVRRGTAFTHAFIPGGTCAAVCMPSRAMLHTGRTLFRLNEAGSTIPVEHRTLGETLREAGYHTFGSGKWHNGHESFHRSFCDGDEIFFGGMADHWNVPAFHYDPTGKYATRCRVIDSPLSSNKTQSRMCDHIHAGKHSTDLIGETGVRFLQEYQGKDPYFLSLAFLAPHDPRSMPDEYLAMYDPEQITLPANFLPVHPFDNGELQIRDEKLAASPRTPAEIRRHLAEYYAMITHLDDHVGRLVAAVEARGDLENTIFVLCGDNGLALGQHGLMGKQSLYDHSVRVPLVMAGPGIDKGATTEAFAYLLDIFPTLCELTGSTTPASVDGISLAQALRGEGPVRDSLYLAYRDRHRGVRTPTHKLIEYVVDGRHTQTQLFDLKADPLEQRNLAVEPAQSERLRELRKAMIRLRDVWEDDQSPWGRVFWPIFENSLE